MAKNMKREVSSVQHPLVKHLVRLRQNRDYREEHQSVVIEGSKLIGEVCQHLHAKLVAAYDETLIPHDITADEVILVNEAVMHKLSGVQTPEGLIAEVAMPKPPTMNKARFVLACDGVSDPGNLGTLLRTGLALGWDGVFILDNSCDPYNDKALRAAKGATFRLPILMGSWNDLKNLIKKNKWNLLVADVSGTPIDETTVKDGVLLLMSNEARGASTEALKLGQCVTIPMLGTMESLNVAVAGGILMYTLKKRQQ